MLPFVDPDPELYGELGSGWGALSEYAVVSDLQAYPDGKAPDVAYAQIVLPEDINHVDAVMMNLREISRRLMDFSFFINPNDPFKIWIIICPWEIFWKNKSLCRLTGGPGCDMQSDRCAS